MAKEKVAETTEAPPEAETTFCGMKARLFGAKCLLANARLFEPKNAEPDQLTDLKFQIFNLTPDDLEKSCLGPMAFPPRSAMSQMHMAEVGREPSELMALTGEYKPGGECHSKGHNVAIFPSNEYHGAKPIYLEPRHGIAIKKVSRSASSNEADPAVDIIIMVKGLPTGEVGRIDPDAWTLMDFELGFKNKIGGDSGNGDAPEEEPEGEE